MTAQNDSRLAAISHPGVLEHLQAAIDASEANDLTQAMISAALAFASARAAHFAARQSEYPPGWRWASLDQIAASRLHGLLGNGMSGFDEDSRSLDRLAKSATDKLLNAFTTIADAVEIVGIGLNIDDYVLFLAHKPVVRPLIGGKMHVELMHPVTDNAAIVARCLQFVIEYAVRAKL